MKETDRTNETAVTEGDKFDEFVREQNAAAYWRERCHDAEDAVRKSGSAAKMRVALYEIERMVQWGGSDFGNPVVRGLLNTLTAVRNVALSALSEPPRNCDKRATNADEAIVALKQRFPVEEFFAGFEMAAKWLYDTQDYCLGEVADRPFGQPEKGGEA